MKQFEIWWANLPQPAGRRPVVLLSRNSAYDYMAKVIVAEVTTTIRSIAVEVPLGKTEGLHSACVINCDNLRTVSKSLLVKRAGSLSTRRHGELKRAVGFALGWEELIDSE